MTAILPGLPGHVPQAKKKALTIFDVMKVKAILAAEDDRRWVYESHCRLLDGLSQFYDGQKQGTKT